MARLSGWPVTLTEPDLLGAPVVLRPARASDERTCRNARTANASWLRRWDASVPEGPSRLLPIDPILSLIRRSPVFPYVWAARRRWEARQGTAYSWVIRYDGQFAGQLMVWHIVWGSNRSAEIGYWIEAGIRPENTASRRAVQKLGFRDEGTRVRQVHIDGAWRDHICYAITAEEAPGGLLPQWRRSFATSTT